MKIFNSFRYSIFVLLFILIAGQPARANLKIASPPLVSSSFQRNDVEGRHEFVYINFDAVDGYGFERTRREARSNQLAVTTNYGFYYLSGEQTYEQDGDEIKHETDYYYFIPAGVNVELQHHLGKNINLIVFAGPRLHYGRSKDITEYQGSITSGTTNDYGFGGEVGLLLGFKTEIFLITPFVSFDKMRVKSTSSADDTDDQTFTFDSRTVGLDILHRNSGLTLSALFGTPEHEDNDELDDFTIIKLGWMF